MKIKELHLKNDTLQDYEEIHGEFSKTIRRWRDSTEIEKIVVQSACGFEYEITWDGESPVAITTALPSSKREEQKKKEFTYKNYIYCNKLFLDVCGNVFEIKKGMDTEEVIGLWRNIEQHIPYHVPERVCKYEESKFESYIEIGDLKISVKYHIKDHMYPKDILCIFMEALERIDRYIKEGK